MFLTTRTGLVSSTPQCRKCKSYLVFPRMKDGVWFHKCKECGKITYDKFNLKTILFRMKFWKS